MKYRHVDAFTDCSFAGNPCAVFLDAQDLTTEQMLIIAKEMNLSESAFLVSSDRADFGARYFTPAGEIPMAGHPTMSLFHVLREEGRVNSEVVTLELPAGIFEITFQDELILMEQNKPQFLRTYSCQEVAAAFNLNINDICQDPQTVSTGTPMLMIELTHSDALERARIDHDGYKKLVKSGDFFSPHLFSFDGKTSEARHLGFYPEPPEDPFTGSATGAMACYLYRYGRLKEEHFTALQGHHMGRPGRAEVWVGDWGVRIGGKAITVVEGQLIL